MGKEDEQGDTRSRFQVTRKEETVKVNEEEETDIPTVKKTIRENRSREWLTLRDHGNNSCSTAEREQEITTEITLSHPTDNVSKIIAKEAGEIVKEEQIS